MRRSTSLSRLAVAVALSGALISSPHAQGPVKAADSGADAVAACERAARQSLATRGAPAADVQFNAAPAAQPGLANDGPIVLRGAGSWRAAGGMRKFEYSCSVDPRAPDAVGLVMRDKTPMAAEVRPARREQPPDLSHLSPAACESSVAEALKKRWPRVSEIRFDSTARRFEQASPSKAELHGQGRALPAQGSPQTFFGFDCEIDPRDGRVLGTRVSG